MGFFKLVVWNVLLACSLIGHAAASVSYDHKAITINGHRRILLSGSIHYPRSTPEVFTLKCAFWGLFPVGLFLSNGYLKVSSFSPTKVVCIANFWVSFLFSDVARSYTEGQGRRFGCDSDLCFLEWTWTFTWQSNEQCILVLLAIFEFFFFFVVRINDFFSLWYV